VKERNEPSVNTCLRVADSEDSCLQHVATCTVPKVPKKPCIWGQEFPTTVHGAVLQRTRYLPPNNLKPKWSLMTAYIDNLLLTNFRTPPWKTHVDMTVFPTECAVSTELEGFFKITSESIRNDSVSLIHILRYSHLYSYLLTYSMGQSPSWEANWFCS